MKLLDCFHRAEFVVSLGVIRVLGIDWDYQIIVGGKMIKWNGWNRKVNRFWNGGDEKRPSILEIFSCCLQLDNKSFRAMLWKSNCQRKLSVLGWSFRYTWLNGWNLRCISNRMQYWTWMSFYISFPTKIAILSWWNLSALKLLLFTNPCFLSEWEKLTERSQTNWVWVQHQPHLFCFLFLFLLK